MIFDRFSGIIFLGECGINRHHKANFDDIISRVTRSFPARNIRTAIGRYLLAISIAIEVRS
jgi:hypothetical protein